MLTLFEQNRNFAKIALYTFLTQSYVCGDQYMKTYSEIIYLVSCIAHLVKCRGKRKLKKYWVTLY